MNLLKKLKRGYFKLFDNTPQAKKLFCFTGSKLLTEKLQGNGLCF
jgi:hypothetical protein